MNRKMKIVIALVILILLCGVIVSSVVGADVRVTYTGTISNKVTFNTIKGYNLGDYYVGDRKEDKIPDTVVELGEQNYGSYGTYNETAENAILNQGNIFCVQHGIGILNGARYNVSGKNTPSDPALSYILYQATGQAKDNYKEDAVQVALWKYLYDNPDSPDSQVILEDMSFTQYPSEYDINTEAQRIYNAAMQYEANTIESLKPTVVFTDTYIQGEDLIEIPSTQIGVYVSGKRNEVYNYKLEVINNNNTTVVDTDIVLSMPDNGNALYITYDKAGFEARYPGYKGIKVTVSISTYVYKAKYRKLTSDGNQRLIVLTDKYNEEIILEDSAENNNGTSTPNVSLQKYIYQVKGTNVSSGMIKNEDKDTQQRMVTRRNRVASEKIKTKDIAYDYNTTDDVDYKVTDGYFNSKYYKINSPVQIERENTVTYRIEVYNNREISVNNVTIQDYLYYVIGRETQGDKLSIGTGTDKDIIIKSVKKANAAINYTLNNNILNISIGSIEAKKSITIDVELQFNCNIGNRKVANYAELNYSNNIYRTEDADYIVYEESKLGLEKYISAVNDVGLGDIYEGIRRDEEGNITRVPENKNIIVYEKDATRNDAESRMTGRWSKIASNEFKSGNYATDQNASITSTKIDEKYYGNEAYYKINNPVQLEQGDIVTYNIYVHNNGSAVEKNIEVEDHLYYLDKQTNQKLYLPKERFQIIEYKIGIKNKGAERYTGVEESPENYSGSSRTVWYIDSLNAESTARITLKVRITTQGTNIKDVENYAFLKQGNSTYRCEDADYVRLNAEYKVSLEKYVTKVNDINIHAKKYDFNEDGLVDEKDCKLIEDYVDGKISDDNIKRNIEMGSIDTSDDIGDEESNEITAIILNKEDGYTNYNFNNDELIDANDVLCLEDYIAGETLSEEIKFNIRKNANIYKENDIKKSDADILRAILNSSDANVSKYDFNEDGIVNDIDAQLLTKYYLNQIDNYAIKERIQVYGDIDKSGEITGKDDYALRKISRSYKRCYPKEGDTYANIVKPNNPVMIEKGDEVTYVIKVKNDGQTIIKNIKIADYLPSGVNGSNVQVGRVIKYDSNDNLTNQEINSEIRTGTTMMEIQIKDAILNPGEKIYVEVSIPEVIGTGVDDEILENRAKISIIHNRNTVTVTDATPDDNEDADFVKFKEYKVSLEKFISKVSRMVNGNEVTVSEHQRAGKAQHYYDDDPSTENKYKYNNPETVSQYNIVEYIIEVTNNGDTKVKNFMVKDAFERRFIIL